MPRRKGPGPDGKPLPDGLFWDGKRYRIQPRPGMKRESAGTHKGRALALLRRRRRELETGTPSADIQLRASTIDALAKLYFDDHKNPFESAWAARSRGQYDKWLSPAIGSLTPSDLTPPMLLKVLTTPYKAKKLAAATVGNLNGTLSTIFEHGRFLGLVEDNPCQRLKGKLPSKRKQERPCYTDAETVVLLSDLRIPAEWRVFYSLQAFTGMRCGEAAGRRFADYDRSAPGLGSLHVHSQYDDRRLKTADGDNLRERIVPVHPKLAAILAEWKLSGFAACYGRKPSDSDFIVPDARTMHALTSGIVSKRAPKDCATVELKCKGMHGLRRFFITYARAGGAPKDMVERVTHNAKGDIIDVYTSAEVWPAMCEAVRCLRVQWSEWTRERTQAK